jgi:hypothetical protein
MWTSIYFSGDITFGVVQCRTALLFGSELISVALFEGDCPFRPVTIVLQRRYRVKGCFHQTRFAISTDTDIWLMVYPVNWSPEYFPCLCKSRDKSQNRILVEIVTAGRQDTHSFNIDRGYNNWCKESLDKSMTQTTLRNKGSSGVFHQHI